ncbi:MAG TPA: MFS transporter, partial [Candidatus Binatus sp.]|nr:MFS transporter [Candidatus Binatus sp.]
MGQESFSYRVLYVVAMNHAVNDGSVYVLSSLFPVVIGLYSLTVFEVSILVAIGYLVGVVCQPIVGHYSEGRDPARLLAVGISIIAVSLASFIFTAGFISLLGSVILIRVGSSFFHPVGISTVSRTYDGPRLQSAMGFQSSFGNLGVLVVFLTSAPLYLILGWRAAFASFAIVAVIDVMVTISFLRMRAKPRSSPDQGAQKLPRPRTLSLSLPIFFILAAFISGGSYAVILNFANILLGGPARLDVTVSNLVVSSFIAAAALGALSTGLRRRFLKTSVNLAVSYLLASAALALFTVFSANVTMAVLTLLTTGFLISATYPLTYTELSNYLAATQKDSGRSFGVLSSAQTVGASVLGIVCGYISTLVSLDVSFALVSGLMVLGFVASLFWSRKQGRGEQVVIDALGPEFAGVA